MTDFSKIKLENPYEKAEKLGIKSQKDKIDLKDSDIPCPGQYDANGHAFWDMDGPLDAFDAHRRAYDAQVYGSSLKGKKEE